uniref:Uncharacterized protein TCIL3000_11_14540 n=1 Tax=Trypanosoma congolense (strain IL3000) TaxID=1068625 RepID=G0V2R5_TRYCI|nr:unnamed protein product [Trypanosoma congolense IL3000]
MEGTSENDFDAGMERGLCNAMLEMAESPSKGDSDDNDIVDIRSAHCCENSTVDDGHTSMSAKSEKQEQSYLAMLSNFQSGTMFDGLSCGGLPAGQSLPSRGLYSFGTALPSHMEAELGESNADTTTRDKRDSFLDSYSAVSSTTQHPLTNESVGSGTCVYSSIATSSLQGRRLNFRLFLTKKAVPAAMMKEGQAGVFVGQLPSSYSEEDTAALLRAIGADAGITVHVRDVKSHNQSRTCAFVTVNRGALEVLLTYSKRVLCDSSCVWVVEKDKAAHLKDFVDGLVRERLRGVPKAALVLEELTPQYVRGQTAGTKEWKSGVASSRDAVGTMDGFFMAMPTMMAHSAPPPPMPTLSEGHVMVGTPQMPMGFVMPSWGGVGQTPASGPQIASGNSQLIGTMPSGNVYGNPGACFLAIPQPGPTAVRSQGMSVCLMAPNSNTVQSIPYMSNYPSGNMYASTRGGPPPNASGGVPLQQVGASASSVQVGLGSFVQQVHGGSPMLFQSLPSYTVQQVIQQQQHQ